MSMPNISSPPKFRINGAKIYTNIIKLELKLAPPLQHWKTMPTRLNDSGKTTENNHHLLNT